MNDSTKKAALVLRALNNPTRVKILDFIRTKGSTTVTKLYIGLRMEQSVMSQHLAILRKTGIVNATRDGKFIEYSICNERVNKINELSEELIGDKGMKLQKY